MECGSSQYRVSRFPLEFIESGVTSKQESKTKQDMTVTFANARAKLGGSVRESVLTS